MYTIHRTNAFVLKSQTIGEANAYMDLFTRDLGLVRATAQGVRHLKSKLRYSLTDFSYSSVSLVRGKEVWRLTNAMKSNDAVEIINEEARQVLYRIFALLRRLLVGEEKHVELFDLVEKVFFILIEKPHSEYRSSIEEITVLRILFLLGYINEQSSLNPYLQGSDYPEQLLKSASQARVEIVGQINESLRISNL